MFNNFFFRKSCCLWRTAEKTWYRKTGHTWQCNMALKRCDLNAAVTKTRIHTHTHTHTQSHYVTLTVLSLQEWLRKCVSLLRHTYCACLGKYKCIKNRLCIVWRTDTSQGRSVVKHRVPTDFCPKLHSYRVGVCHGWRRRSRQSVLLWKPSSTVLFYREENHDILYQHKWNSFSSCQSQSEISCTS